MKATAYGLDKPDLIPFALTDAGGDESHRASIRSSVPLFGGPEIAPCRRPPVRIDAPFLAGRLAVGAGLVDVGTHACGASARAWCRQLRRGLDLRPGALDGRRCLCRAPRERGCSCTATEVRDVSTLPDGQAADVIVHVNHVLAAERCIVIAAGLHEYSEFRVGTLRWSAVFYTSGPSITVMSGEADEKKLAAGFTLFDGMEVRPIASRSPGSAPGSPAPLAPRARRRALMAGATVPAHRPTRTSDAHRRVDVRRTGSG